MSKRSRQFKRLRTKSSSSLFDLWRKSILIGGPQRQRCSMMFFREKASPCVTRHSSRWRYATETPDPMGILEQETLVKMEDATEISDPMGILEQETLVKMEVCN